MRLVSLALVLLPFFVSMVVTNDVALITFVPFAVLVLGLIGRTEYLGPPCGAPDHGRQPWEHGYPGG